MQVHQNLKSAQTIHYILADETFFFLLNNIL